MASLPFITIPNSARVVAFSMRFNERLVTTTHSWYTILTIKVEGVPPKLQRGMETQLQLKLLPQFVNNSSKYNITEMLHKNGRLMVVCSDYTQSFLLYKYKIQTPPPQDAQFAVQHSWHMPEESPSAMLDRAFGADPYIQLHGQRYRMHWDALGTAHSTAAIGNRDQYIQCRINWA